MTVAFYKQKWFFSCLVIALICALASYWYFDSYPELIRETRSGTPISGLAIGTLGCLIASLPFVLIIALTKPRASTIVAAQIHAACYLAFLLLLSFTSGSPGHSSPGSSFAGLIETLLYVIILFELLMILAANSLRKQRGHPAYKVTGIFVFTLIIGTLIGGWFTGVVLWSLKLPSQVLAAAIAEADGNPYCIEAASDTVRSKLSLNALNMYAHYSGGLTLHFHGLLVIQEEKGLKYMNWSYRQDRFDEVSEDVRRRMALDITERCVPSQDFDKKLPLISL